MKKKKLLWIIPIALIWIIGIVLAVSENDAVVSEEKTQEEHPLTGKSVESLEFKEMGEYNEVPCSDWPSVYQVGTFKDEPLSFVIDLRNNSIVHVDSAELSACAFPLVEKNKIINSQFGFTDGRHIKLASKVEKSMNNPATFEHVETKYTINQDGNDEFLFVYMSFRGTNSFGATVIDNIGAKVDFWGNIEEIYQGDDLKWAANKFAQN
jgi:hypothetical protein